jgi:DNA adenine methylase
MKKNPLVAPVVKWVGGKRQLLQDISNHIPDKFFTYYELTYTRFVGHTVVR